MASSDDTEEIKQYRKRPDYTGYEDYTPSGRAALQAYNQEEAKEGYRNRVKRPGAPPYSPTAAKKAQAAQREYESEITRETRGMLPRGSYAKGGTVKSSASRRADGIAKRGKTKGRMY